MASTTRRPSSKFGKTTSIEHKHAKLYVYGNIKDDADGPVLLDPPWVKRAKQARIDEAREREEMKREENLTRGINDAELEMMRHANEERRICLWIISGVCKDLLGIELWNLIDRRERDRRRELLERKRMGGADNQSMVIERYWREKARIERELREREFLRRVTGDYSEWQKEKMGFYINKTSDDHAPPREDVSWICPQVRITASSHRVPA